MALGFFSPQAQEALDLAKRVAGADGEITAGLLIAAAYDVGAMEDELSELHDYLPSVKTRRRKVPEEVSVASPLRPVFEVLATDDFVTIDELMAEVLDSEVGREFLISAGMPVRDFERVKEIVRGNALPEGDGEVETEAEAGEWRSSEERAEVVKALSSYGRMLTEGDPPRQSVVEMDVEMRRLQKTLLNKAKAKEYCQG